jgi:hypothetical protein
VAAAVAHAGAAQRAARDVAAEAAVVLPDVVAVAAAVLPDVAAAEAAGERVAGAEEAAGPGALAVPLSGPPLAWAFHRDQALPWPGPRPSARTAHAMEQRPVAWR